MFGLRLNRGSFPLLGYTSTLLRMLRLGMPRAHFCSNVNAAIDGTCCASQQLKNILWYEVWHTKARRGCRTMRRLASASSAFPALQDLKWEVIGYPPYLPDLAPSDFPLFSSLKTISVVGGRNFESSGELQLAITDFFKNHEATWNATGSDKLVPYTTGIDKLVPYTTGIDKLVP